MYLASAGGPSKLGLALTPAARNGDHVYVGRLRLIIVGFQPPVPSQLFSLFYSSVSFPLSPFTFPIPLFYRFVSITFMVTFA